MDWLELPWRWKTRWDIIGYVKPPPEPIPCPGEGVCHGCLKWCDYCGDVGDVCDCVWPFYCDTHGRYPEKPRPPEPNPNQLWLPGVG
jgi:hypothetical protein